MSNTREETIDEYLSKIKDERAELISKLSGTGVLGDDLNKYDDEFELFLERRKAAKIYQNDKSNTSSHVKNAAAASTPSVYMYYDEKEYEQEDENKGIDPNHARFVTNLYLTSTDGGMNVTDGYGASADSYTNPLNVNRCPQSNITVATNVTFASRGGYFGKKNEEYKPAVEASVLHTYAYEFENFSFEDIRDNKCPFLTINKPDEKDKENYESLSSIGFKANQFVKKQESIQDIYLNKQKYLDFVKQNF